MIKKVEKENRKNSNIDFFKSAHVDDWVPGIGPDDRIVVLEGNHYQRNAVTLKGIESCLGRVGVIAIHNDDLLEMALMQTPKRSPQLIRNCPGLKVSFVNKNIPGYEPLFDMPIERALDVFYPKDGSNGMTEEACSLRREVLEKYLNIVKMETGNISLNYLKALCDLSVDELRYHHLSRLPEELAEDIYKALVTDNLYKSVRADINAFATTCSGRIWYKQEGNEFNTVSLVSAVKSAGLISVKLPSNNSTVLNYLADEIHYLIEAGANFLLVVDNLNVQNTKLQEVLKNPYLGMATMVSVGNGAEWLGGNANVENSIINIATKVIVFRCANANVATRYSDLLGEYMKTFVDWHKDKHKGAFDIFHGHGKGFAFAKHMAPRIEATELVTLGPGALLIDQTNGVIELVENFEC